MSTLGDDFVVNIGLAQLESMHAIGNYKDEKLILEDIAAYKTILSKKLCIEYMQWKKPRINIIGIGQPRHFIEYWKSKC